MYDLLLKVILLFTDVYTFTVRQLQHLVLKQKFNTLASMVLVDKKQ